MKPTKSTATTMTEIELIGTDGKSFKVKFAPVTPGRMDLLLRASKNFTDVDSLIQQTVDAVKLMPELAKSIPNYEQAKGIIDALQGDSEEDKAKKEIISRLILGGGLTSEQLANNLLTYRNYVRIMCLSANLSETEIEWIKSEIESEFWSDQPLETIRTAGEFFRKPVREYK